MKKVLIYKDEGCSSSTNALYDYFVNFADNKPIKVDFTKAADIISKGLNVEETKAIVIPGGHSRKFANKLDGAGNKIIRDFVEAGGLYYGFCGGAYYACKNIDFIGADLKIKREHELCFSTGEAIGSLPNLTNGKYYTGNKDSANTVQLNYKNNTRKVSCYYNGGPRFTIENQAKEVIIATYLDKNPAIIECEVGKGYALLCAVHPEISGENIQLSMNETASDYNHLKDISNVLINDKKERKNFKNTLLNRL